MSKLYPCPYNRAAKCNMKEPCLGCEDFKPKMMTLIYQKKRRCSLDYSNITDRDFIEVSTLCPVADQIEALHKIEGLKEKNRIAGYEMYYNFLLFDEDLKQIALKL